VPGDLSSAAFLIAAAASGGSGLVVEGVGLNPSRSHFLQVLRRMGVVAKQEVTGREVGEPIGTIEVATGSRLEGVVVSPSEAPLVIDELLVLALLAAHADGPSRFEGAGELRVKESDRLTALAEGIRELGGEASIEGDALVVAGGGLGGGRTDARGDHRLAMAFTVGALAARGESEVAGLEWADVSFPGFAAVLAGLGARIEVRGR
jgi:3-phosphoshikimate 1-carboxyvinyltransferase